MNIIAYTYEGDNHCIDCTINKLLVLVDCEGNLVHPPCGDCREIIDTYTAEEVT